MQTTENSLKPTDITDLIYRTNLYITEMRKTKDIETIPRRLNKYVSNYFGNEQTDMDSLHELAKILSDETYRIITALERKDKYTWAYFAKVMPLLWDGLHNRGVDVFYVIDNELREDRFNLVIELFSLTGAAVVAPYDDERTLSAVEVGSILANHMKRKRVIVYVEKNDAVNYISDVLEMANTSDYFVVFRNDNPHPEENSDPENVVNENSQIAGLPSDEYNRSATAYSKSAIGFWIATGLLYNLFIGHLFSWASLLLVFPGVFIISFASIPFFFLNIKKKKVISSLGTHKNIWNAAVDERTPGSKDIPVMLFFTLTTILEWIFPIILAIVAMRLLANV